MPELVAMQATRTPGAVALVADGQTVTYRALNRRANQLAHYLQTLGVGPNVLVGVCLERSLDMVVGLLGIMKAGAAYVPLDPAYPPLRQAFMLEDAQAPVIITHECQATRLPAHQAHVVCLDRDADTLARQNPDDPAPTATADDLAYVIYTSGSTGQPKGVQISHGNLLNLIFWHQRAFSVMCADRATQLAGPAFDATVWELWPYLTLGASVCLPDEETRVTPVRLRDWLVEHKITIAFLPTALAEGVMALEWPRQTTLRYLLTGADTLHRYPSPDLPFTLVNNYGPTENTVVTTSGPVLLTAQADTLPSIGRPIANTQVYILNEQLQQVPIGESGELYIGGASLSRGYLHRPDLTAERFVPHPFSDEPGARLYRTGDLARILPDGQIAFLGRADTQIKIRGYRIEPDEIEMVLSQHQCVSGAVVATRDDSAGEKRLIAYIQLREPIDAAVYELGRFLQERLPLYMIPAAFVFLDALPLTPNGKIDRRALPPPPEELRRSWTAFEESTTSTEQVLTTMWTEILAVHPIGRHDDFLALGGDSLKATRLIARVRSAFQVELPLPMIFQASTVAKLAAFIDDVLIDGDDEVYIE